MGKEHVIDAATKLGLKDPGDTDFNSMIEAVRVYEELRKQYDSEVSVLTGDREVGIKSDKKISEQLDKVLKHFRANFVVLVSDGSEDEQVIPIIQSVIPILSVKRVVVKQSEQLESTYYKVKDFIKESLENPKMSRLVFGLPAIALLLISIFGAEGWRAIMGILGAYLVIKGFRLGSYLTGAADEVADPDDVAVAAEAEDDEGPSFNSPAQARHAENLAAAAGDHIRRPRRLQGIYEHGRLAGHGHIRDHCGLPVRFSLLLLARGHGSMDGQGGQQQEQVRQENRIDTRLRACRNAGNTQRCEPHTAA